MRPLLAVALVALFAPWSPADDAGWIDLMRPDVWKKFDGRWVVTDAVALDPKDPKKLVATKAATGAIWVNGPGRVADLYTKADYGDCEVSLEFLIAKGSNSGIKFHGVYEIQILDSFGKKGPLTGNDLGGLYPRAKLAAPYGYIDDGVGPKVNAAKPPGEWNALSAKWRSPRFDADGKKAADARLLNVTVNGQVVQDDVAVKTATGSNWGKPETAVGPFMLQADHGPTAVRAMKIRPLAK
jgi:hypothetical protein